MTEYSKITAAAAAIAMLAQLTACSSSQVGQANNNTAPVQTTVAENATESATEVQSQSAETTTAAVQSDYSGECELKGSIFSTDGQLLVYSQVNSDGGVSRTQPADYKIPFANIINTMSEGFDLTFDEQLRKQNPSSDPGTQGQSIRLTLDAGVQSSIYQYMQDNNLVGSVVVMRTDGSIMSEVSYPSYDPDQYAETDHDEDLAWGTYGNKAFQNYEPGSCFKIMSEVIADKHGVTSVYDEGKWEYGVFPIVNWDYEKNTSYPFERSLNSAFVNSSNIFFAKAFDQIGTDAVLSDLSSIFHFGLDDDIYCDFGSIENNIEVYCDDDLRRSAFGQSYVLTCPIFLAALGREAVFGDMVKPFVIQSYVDTNDSNTVIAEGTARSEVIASIPQEYRQNLLDGMAGVASGLGVAVPSGYTFYAKTGTAETWVGDFLYITGCVKKDGDTGSTVYDDYSSYSSTGSYVIVMQIQNPEEHGLEFASQSARYYSGIVNIVLS